MTNLDQTLHDLDNALDKMETSFHQLDQTIEKLVKTFPKSYREDLRQECHIKALEVPKTKGMGYLWTAMRNACRDHVRLLKGNLDLTLDEPTNNENGEEMGTNADNLISWDDTSHEALPDNETIRLWVEGWTPKEISDMLGGSQRTHQRIIKQYKDSL